MLDLHLRQQARAAGDRQDGTAVVPDRDRTALGAEDRQAAADHGQLQVADRLGAHEVEGDAGELRDLRRRPAPSGLRGRELAPGQRVRVLGAVGDVAAGRDDEDPAPLVRHRSQGQVDDPLLAVGDEVPAGRTQRLAGRDDLVAPPPHLVGDLVVEAPPAALPERRPDRAVAVEAASFDGEPVGVEDPAGGVEEPREQQGRLEECVEPARGQHVAARGPQPDPQAGRAGGQVADHLGLVLAQGRPLCRRAAGRGGRVLRQGCPMSTLPTGRRILTRQFSGSRWRSCRTPRVSICPIRRAQVGTSPCSLRTRSRCRPAATTASRRPTRRRNETSLFNAYYNEPEILRLAGDVSGRRILDAGCGSGPLSAALRAEGAVVTGFDGSAAMVDLARKRLGDDADVRVADLGEPLPFPTTSSTTSSRHSSCTT